MLKIKNNIDLIELEIFNFYDMGNCYQKYLEFGVQLYVDKQTRIITRNAPYDARYIPNKDEISDLIKADIVEDVAEEITYAYGVNLEEDIIIIEKQQKRIAELEQDLEFTTKTANDLIGIKHKLEQQLKKKQKRREKMSKEKQCECCHEWWYSSDIKKDLCPNCYYYFKQLKQQLAEKDKEIEKLKQQYTILENENGKLTAELIMDKYRKAQKEVSFGKQLAIQELEKVKDYICDCTYIKEPDYTNVRRKIDNQIKELKGEKDE